MHPHPDDIQQIKADLVAWLRQNEAAGQAWYLDEGEPPPLASSPSAMASPVAAQEPVSSTHPETVEAPAVPEDDPFAAECAAFVQETLTSYTRLIGDTPVSAALPSAPSDLDALRQEVLPCTRCSLHESRQHTVFGAGDPQAGILFIGEAPGRDEDLQGEPFVGRSGQLLTKIIAAIGLSRDQVYICNILKCRPPNNRDPLPAEVACCEPFLQRQLEIIRPRVICCLGRVAAQTLLKTDASLRALRETAHFYAGIPVMATYHPAALLRNPGWKRETWNDVRKLRALHDALLAGSGEKE